MLKMSFYDGTLDREKAKEFVSKTEKNIVFTSGFESRNPTTRRVPIKLSEALIIINNENYLDIKEEEDCIHLNSFSANDMW